MKDLVVLEYSSLYYMHMYMYLAYMCIAGTVHRRPFTNQIQLLESIICKLWETNLVLSVVLL